MARLHVDMFLVLLAIFFNLYVALGKNLVTIFKQKNHCNKEYESQKKYP